MQTFAKKSGEFSSGETATDLGWADSILPGLTDESVLFVTFACAVFLV